MTPKKIQKTKGMGGGRAVGRAAGEEMMEARKRQREEDVDVGKYGCRLPITTLSHKGSMPHVLYTPPVWAWLPTHAGGFHQVKQHELALTILHPSTPDYHLVHPPPLYEFRSPAASRPPSNPNELIHERSSELDTSSEGKAFKRSLKI